MGRACLAVLAATLVALSFVASASARVEVLSPASGPSPFGAACGGSVQEGVLYLNSEVEPFVSVNPANRSNLVGVWQQDRWSTGGANGALTAFSRDGGRSWRRPTPPPFSRCAGGNAANAGDYARASDPWVSFSPNGDAHQIALTLESQAAGPNAVLASSSRDGGRTWGPVKTLIRDEDAARFFNDKESITADPTDSRYVYAVWDRLEATTPGALFRGPTYFARSVDGGRSWEQAGSIYDPGADSQTVGNQIAVLPSGRLVNFFTVFRRGVAAVAAIYSDDRGVSWSRRAVVIEVLGSIGVEDPHDGAAVRTGDILPEVAVDPRPNSDNLYVVWQDARFNGFERDQVAFSRSTDGGETWSPPKRISADNETQAFTPSVEVNGRGQLAVTYYDFTRDTPASPQLRTDYWVSRSADRGATFGPRERITPRSFDMRSAPVARGYFLGDYEGLAAGRVEFKPLFSQANDGDAVNPTDIFSTAVTGPLSTPRAPGSRTVDRSGAAAGRHQPGRPFNNRVRPYITPSAHGPQSSWAKGA